MSRPPHPRTLGSAGPPRANSATGGGATFGGDSPALAWASLEPVLETSTTTGVVNAVLVGEGTNDYDLVFRGLLLRGSDGPARVAVKILKFGRLPDSTYAFFLDIARREADILKQANDDDSNEHIVKSFGFVRGPAPHWVERLGRHRGDCVRAAGKADHGQMCALVMAYVEGGSLRAFIHGEGVRSDTVFQAAVAASAGAGASSRRASSASIGSAAAAAAPLPSSPPQPYVHTPIGARLDILLQIASGLMCLHGNSGGPLIHADLKPDNILLSRGVDGTLCVKLIGFCLSERKREVAISTASIDLDPSEVDEAQALRKGTWPYMCPRLYLQSDDSPALKPSRATDMFAFGTIAWEVLSGATPWGDVDEVHRVMMLRKGGSLDMGLLHEGTHEEVRTLIRDCLSNNITGPEGTPLRPRADHAWGILQRAIDRIGNVPHTLPLTSMPVASLLPPSLPTSFSSVSSSPALRRLISWEHLTPSASGSLAVSPLHGGMGVVFHAHWKQHSLSPSVAVAVKLLKTAFLNSRDLSDTVSALEAEAAAMAAANSSFAHSNVAVLFGLARGPPTPAWLAALGDSLGAVLGADKQLLGLVTRWESGGTLHSLLHDSKRAWAATTATRLRLCADIASGLAHLHGGDPCILHGDIKPENVLLSGSSSGDLNPILTDFGLSSVHAMAERGSRISKAVSADEKRGSWPYMAPEMLGRMVDAKGKREAPTAASRSTDVYALATLT